jgi:hypothetical protein
MEKEGGKEGRTQGGRKRGKEGRKVEAEPAGADL